LKPLDYKPFIAFFSTDCSLDTGRESRGQRSKARS